MEKAGDEEEMTSKAETKKICRPTKYKCKRCSRKFKDLKLLHEHLQLHRVKQESGKYKCKLCPALFSDFFEFIRHKKGHRNDEFKRVDQSSYDKLHHEVSAEYDYHGSTNASSLEVPQNGRRSDVSKFPDIDPTCQKGISEDAGHSLPLLSTIEQTHEDNLVSPGSQSSVFSGSFSDTSERRQFGSHLKMIGNDVLQIDSPSPLRSIKFNTSSMEIGSILTQVKEVNNKLDALIRHFNVPLDHAEPITPTSFRRPRVSTGQKFNVPPNSESIEPIPSCCDMSKEQTTQGYYSASMAPPSLKSWALSSSPTMYSTQSSETISKEYPRTNIPKAEEEGAHVVTSVTSSLIKSSSAALRGCILTDEQIEKLYVVSRSRGNFAKNLTFAVYSQEERYGRNCTGRVFGKAIPKGQLDPTKLNYVKELTFQKYPCHPSLIDFTWKKKCVTAIDSGLRNENRVRSRRQGGLRGDMNHTF